MSTIHTGQSRALSGVTLAAIIAAGCSGKVEREQAEPSGSAGAPLAGVGGNSSRHHDDPLDGAYVGGSANGQAGASASSPSSSGMGGTWAAAGGAPLSAGAAGGAPVGPGAAGGAAIGGAPTCTPSGDGATSSAGVGGAWPDGLGAGGFGPVCVSPTAGDQVSLTPVDGWLDGASNTLHIQGATYAGADDRSALTMTSDFTGSKMCIKGSTAVVEYPCTAVPPAPDCWATTWGAAIYLNLNQAAVGSTGAVFDAKALQGFAFELSGPSVPPRSYFRFQVEAANPDLAYCLQYSFNPGDNVALLSQLRSEYVLPICSPSVNTVETATYAASRLVRLKWMVNATLQEIPYDFCVSNVRAVLK